MHLHFNKVRRSTTFFTTEITDQPRKRTLVPVEALATCDSKTRRLASGTLLFIALLTKNDRSIYTGSAIANISLFTLQPSEE